MWVQRVRDAHLKKSSRFVLRSLRQLHCNSSETITHNSEVIQKPLGPIYKRPGNVAAVALISRLAIRTMAHNVKNSFFGSHWSIVIRRLPDRASDAESVETVIGSIGSRDWQAADPCLHAKDDQLYCFFERMPRGRQGRGEIAAVRVLSEGKLSEPKSILALSSHLSYPFVFDWQGQSFMLTESAETGGIGVWEAHRYPLVWRRRETWLEGQCAYDPTLFDWQGCWFLFVTLDESGGGANDELFLFTANTPLGPWQPHRANPVVSDCRYARPAGRLFMQGATLIRPAQDCSGAYGRAINLCAVDLMTPDHFSQRPVGRIDPRAVGGSIGCHTLSRLNGIEALDLRRMRPDLRLRRRSPRHP
jgi:hypothetical protein